MLTNDIVSFEQPGPVFLYFFQGYGWVLLDACYPSDVQNPLLVRGWHEFFAKLGVEDFISIKAKDEHLTKTTIVSILIIVLSCKLLVSFISFM